MRFSASDITSERRSVPIITLSLAYSNSSMATTRLPMRAASRAASLTRFARSAPEKPGVPRAMILGSTSEASGTLRMCTRRIFSRPFTSGFGTTTWRSKRPGRSSAGSSTSGRLVAAIRMTPSLDSKPSISTSIWFSVCSRSSLPPPRPAPRWRPTASISSMKMMQGAFFLPCSNMSRTRRGADADEHLDEVRAGDGEERHVRLAGDGARQQRLAGAGRADQQHALGDLAAEALEFLRVLQELDDFLQLALGLVDAGDVLEGHAALLLGQHAGAGLAEAHGPAAARLHLAHEEHPDADQQQHREPGQQVVQQRIDVAFLGLGDHAHALVGQALDQRRVFRGVGLEAAPIGQRAGNGAALDDHVAHAPAIHLGDEVGIGDLGGGGVRCTRLEQIEQHHQQKGDDDPKREVAAEIAHVLWLSPTLGSCQLQCPVHPRQAEVGRDIAPNARPGAGRRMVGPLGTYQ